MSTSYEFFSAGDSTNMVRSDKKMRQRIFLLNYKIDTQKHLPPVRLDEAAAPTYGYDFVDGLITNATACNSY